MQPPLIGKKTDAPSLFLNNSTQNEKKSVESRTEEIFEPSKVDVEDKVRSEADLQLISRIKNTVRGLLEQIFVKYEPVKEAGDLSMTDYLTYIAYMELTINRKPNFRQIFAFIQYSLRESDNYNFTNETINFYINEMKSGLAPEETQILDLVSQLSRMKVLKKLKVGYFCNCNNFTSDNTLHQLIQKLISADVKIFDVKFKSYVPKKILALSFELGIPISKITVRDWIQHALYSIIQKDRTITLPIKKCFLGIVHSINYHGSILFEKNINTYAEFFKTLKDKFNILKTAYPHYERVLDNLEHISRSIKSHKMTTIECCSILNASLIPSPHYVSNSENKCRFFDFPIRDFLRCKIV